MRYGYTILLSILVAGIALMSTATAQDVDSSGRLLSPYAYSSNNVNWVRVYGSATDILNATYDTTDTLDQSHYYSVHNLSSTLYPTFNLNLNQGVNYTYTLRSGRTVEGSISVYDAGDPINYYVTMTNDGATVTTKHFKLPFYPVYCMFELTLYNNTGAYQYAVGSAAVAMDCGLALSPVSGVSDSITSVYVVPEGQYYDHWYMMFDTPFTVDVREMKGLYSTIDTSPIYGTPNQPLDIFGDLVNRAKDLLNLITTIYNTFIMLIMLLLACVLFVLGPVPGKGIPGQNFIMMMLLLETGYTALVLNTAKDIFTATRKWVQFQTNTYMFLVKGAEIMIRFFYWMLSATVTVYNFIVVAGTAVANTLINLIGAIIPF